MASTCPVGHQSEAGDYCDTCGRVIGGEAPAVPAPSPTPVTAPAGSGGATGGCPQCGAERNGRFCEECGYDFDLAEVMPSAPGTGAGPELEAVGRPGPQEPAPEPEAERASTAVEPGPPTEAEPSGEPGGGIDLDAELAAAEEELASTVAGGGSGEPEHAVEFGALPDTGEHPNPLPPQIPAPALNPGFGAVELNLVVNADLDYYRAQVDRGDIIESEFPFPKYPSERTFTFAEGPVRVGRASASRGLNPEIDLTGPPLDPAVSHLHVQLLQHDEGWIVVDMGSANGTRLNDAEEPLEAEVEIPVKPGDRIHLGVWTTITVQ